MISLLLSAAVLAAPPLPKAPLGFSRFGTAAQRLTLDVYHDLCCPFSQKMFLTLFGADGCGGVASAVDAARPGCVEWTWRAVPQPWHAQSSYMHEAALAAHSCDAHKIYPCLAALFANQAEFFDDKSLHMSRQQMYDRLAQIAERAGVDRSAVLSQLRLTGDGNSGVGVTQALKWHVRSHRKAGVHVTPTVYVNGIEAVQVSSGWDADEWALFLDEQLE